MVSTLFMTRITGTGGNCGAQSSTLIIRGLVLDEIKYSDIPYKVAINEVVELAKKYGEETSKNFINGILAVVVKEIEE